VEGTCSRTSIKANGGVKARFQKSPKPEARGIFEKAVIAYGTTFKIIAAFVVTSTPYGNDSPYCEGLGLQRLA